jgi:phospholipase/carboxylesterase
MMSLSLLLAHPTKVAGVVAMSGRLPTHALERLTEPDKLAGLPVLVTHGLYDPVLPVESGREIRAQLAALPVALTYREYPMGHEVSLDSLRDVARWLADVLTAAEGGASAGS